MEQKKERVLACFLMIALLVVGVVCYAGFPQTPPENPVRIMMKNTAGKVLFDHKLHASEDGYALDCMDCHHDMDDEASEPYPCGECHMPDDSEDSPKRSDAFHMNCKGCHEDDGTAPVDCSGCHVL